MTEKELIRELGELRANYSLCDTSAENIERGERIKAIMSELGLASKPKADRRKSVIVWR